jgi:hypothetical protein
LTAVLAPKDFRRFLTSIIQKIGWSLYDTHFFQIFKRFLISLRRFPAPTPFLPSLRSREHRYRIGNNLVPQQLELFVKKLERSHFGQGIWGRVRFLSIKKEADKSSAGAQQALCAEDWGDAPIRVRMGLHSGAVEDAEDEIFRGPTLARAA